MTSMRRMGVEQRRARVGVRHHLAPAHRAADVRAVAHDLCGLHATDPVTVYLSARARLAGFAVGQLEAALYDDRVLVRMLGMRRTMFVLPVDLAPVIHQACTAKIAATNRTRLVKLLEASGVTPAVPWLREVEEAVIGALHARGEALATELSADVPALQTKIGIATDKAYGGPIAVNNQVLSMLAAEGRIVRGRPRGRWTTTQYRWAPIDRWIADPLDAISGVDAELVLARQWLATFGPATEADLRWWAGWTATQARCALAAMDAVEVELDEGIGWVLPDDVDDVPKPKPWVALLPALDPASMGWVDRDWYLGPHKPMVIDRTGNIGATVWADGRVIGGWTQRKDGEIVTRLLEDVGRATSTAVDKEAASLETWLGDVRFKPKFPAPLDKELFAG